MIGKANVRSGTSEEWAEHNYVIAQDDIAFDTTVGSYKIGDGTKTFDQLDFVEDKTGVPKIVVNPTGDLNGLISVLTKVGSQTAGSDTYTTYAGLVTVAEDGVIPPWKSSGSDGWSLAAPTTSMKYPDVTNADAKFPGDEITAGVYMAVYYAHTQGPPTEFPPGWTYGNTTGEGPVLPLLFSYSGEGFSQKVYGGLVDVDHVLHDTDYDGGLEGRASHMFLLKPTTPLTQEGYENGDLYASAGDPAGPYVAFVDLADTEPAPTALQDGWSLQPLGLGAAAPLAKAILDAVPKSSTLYSQKAVYTIGGSVASQAYHNFDFVKASGADLLDLTDPAAPKFKTDGIYAVTAFVEGDGAAPATANREVYIELDVADQSINGAEVLRQQVSGQTSGWRRSLTLTYAVSVNDVVAVAVKNLDSATIGTDGQVCIQKIA